MGYASLHTAAPPAPFTYFRRLIDSLSHAALEALTSSLPGCRQLKHLDLSSNRLSDTCGSGSNTAAGQACDAEDAAWARLVAALAQCCPDLEALHASGSSLGPLAAAALAKLMRVRDCKLGRLHLDSCTSIGLVRAALHSRRARTCHAALLCSALQAQPLQHTLTPHPPHHHTPHLPHRMRAGRGHSSGQCRGCWWALAAP